jgi:hypothetical protein
VSQNVISKKGIYAFTKWQEGHLIQNIPLKISHFIIIMFLLLKGLMGGRIDFSARGSISRVGIFVGPTSYIQVEKLISTVVSILYLPSDLKSYIF